MNCGLLVCKASVESSVDGAVAGIAAMCQFDVAIADSTVVGGIEAQPVVAIEDFHPGMGFAFAHEEAVDVAGGNA